MAERELFAVELRECDGAWVPSVRKVRRTFGEAQLEIERVAELGPPDGIRVVRYVPEDPTPGHLATWQDKHRGQVAWKSDLGSILCVLTADDGRTAVGSSVPLDPFGAARAALVAWEKKWRSE